MSTFVSVLAYGLADGAILALAALGFVLIYKATSVINFAQGEFLLVGAYMFYTAFVVMGLPLLLAVLVGVIVATIIGVLVERLILRPMIGESAISIIMVTIGLSSLLRALVQMFYGTRPQPMPAILPRGSVQVLGARCRSTGWSSSSSPRSCLPPSRSSSASRGTASRCGRWPTTSRRR